MKTRSSAYIVLACLITIPTLTGVSTQNVYAAGVGEFNVHLKNWQTDEESECETGLVAPIFTKVSVMDEAKTKKPSGVGISTTMVYYWPFFNDGTPCRSTSSNVENWARSPGSASRNETQMRFVIAPSAGQTFKAFTTIWEITPPALRKVRVSMQFMSLATGHVCTLDTVSRDFKDLVVEATAEWIGVDE